MKIKINKNDCIVFDLDDTLYKELDYLKSAYRFISVQLSSEIGHSVYDEMLELKASGAVVFDVILEKYNIKKFTVKDLIFLYRFHRPDITLSKGVQETLDYLSHHQIRMGIITDGRSISQRNKLKALNIEQYFHKIIISDEIGHEKPNAQNYLFHMIDFPEGQFTYIGDNFSKDFVTPNRLGWNTIGLIDNGENIHSQNVTVSKEYLPQLTMNSFDELQFVI